MRFVSSLVLACLLLLAGCARAPAFDLKVAAAQVQSFYDQRPACVWIPVTNQADRHTPGFLPPFARRDEERAAFRPLVEAGLLEEVPSRIGASARPGWRYRQAPGSTAVLATCYAISGYPITFGSGLIYARRELVSIKLGKPYRAYCDSWVRSARLEYRIIDFADWYDEARFGAMIYVRYARSDAGRLQTGDMEFEVMEGRWGINMREGHRRPCVAPAPAPRRQRGREAASRASASISSMLAPLGVTQLPPTHRIGSNASHSGALAGVIPPVGQNLA